MIKTWVIVCICFSISVVVSSQQPKGTFTPTEKKYMQTLEELIAALRKKPTVPLLFHDSPYYSGEEAFYDTLISSFFQKEKLLTRLAIDTAVFAVQGKMDILRHIMNRCDYFLDVVPPDSMCIRSNNAIPNNEKNPISNALQILLLINGHELPVLLLSFDEVSSRLLMLDPVGNSDSNIVYSFLKRQKGYYAYPDPWGGN